MTGASAGEISEFVRLCVKKEMPEQQQPDILSGYLCCVLLLFFLSSVASSVGLSYQF